MDSPERARLNLEDERVQKDNGNYVILGGGWMAGDKNKNEWIQVRFWFERDRGWSFLYVSKVKIYMNKKNNHTYSVQISG